MNSPLHFSGPPTPTNEEETGCSLGIGGKGWYVSSDMIDVSAPFIYFIYLESFINARYKLPQQQIKSHTKTSTASEMRGGQTDSEVPARHAPAHWRTYIYKNIDNKIT